MKQMILIVLLAISSSAFADVKWQVVNDSKGNRVAKIRNFSVQRTFDGQTLYVRTEDDMFTISSEVIGKMGFSIKEFMDFLKEYDASKEQTLFFNAVKSKRVGEGLESIDSLIIFEKR